MPDTTTPDTVSQTLATWVRELTFADIPGHILEHSKLQFLDALGVILAASSMDVGSVVRRAALDMGAGSESRIWGFGDRVSAASAALANGTMGHALDYDDTHNEFNDASQRADGDSGIDPGRGHGDQRARYSGSGDRGR